MNENRVVDVKDLEKITQFINDIKTNAKPLSSFKHIPVITGETDIDEKHKAIFHHVRGNQDIIKRNVIEAFKDKPGYSRKIVLRKIKELDRQYGMIIVRPDKKNSRIHHLFVNNDNELVSLIEDFDSFQIGYFDLINTLNSLVNNKRIIFTGVLGLIENLRLVSALVTPFKLLLKTYATFDLLLSHNSDNVYLHRRFAIIRDTISEIQNKLYDSVFKEPLVSYDFNHLHDKTIANHLYDNLNLLNNILHGTIQGSSYEDIEAMLITFDQFGLIENAETLLDRLWKIIYPVFPIIYPRYYKENPDVLRDWRKVIQNFTDFDVIAQKFEYEKRMVGRAIEMNG